jgi:RNase P subunit RPR2
MFPIRAMTIFLIVGVMPVPVAAEDLQTGVFNSSEVCGECHQEIYSMWKRSLHSMAYTDPIFQASYMRVYLETQGEAKRTCLRCHAPVAAMTGDLDMQEEISREGITCDFCHSIKSINLDNQEQPFLIALDGVKRGPLVDAESPTHEVEKSDLHQSSKFCAGCHEYVNPDGLSILSTYSEWRVSPQAAAGKSCQHCHMPLIPGETVSEDFDIQRGKVNLHNISGGHSREQVRKAATATILSVRREKPDVGVVEVEVANVGSGHSIPTGMPTRRLVLEVELLVGGISVHRFERNYQRRLLDDNGKVIFDDHRVMTVARKLLDDTRLEPGERRIERLVTEVPTRGALNARMRLRYVYEPQLLSREPISIEIAAENSP